MGPSNAEAVAEAVERASAALTARFDKSKGPLTPLGVLQKASRRDTGPGPHVWAVPVLCPAPNEDGVKDVMLDAIKALADEDTRVLPFEKAPVAAEWVGVRHISTDSVGETPKERFIALNNDVDSNTTIVFVHGGGYYQGGPGTSRSVAAKLAKESGARVLVLDYRLAPQSAFPSQILDLFILYLSLLYPPQDSLHDPVTPSSVVFAGESCGGAICLGLIQALIQLGDRKVQFHGLEVPVPMPAGVAIVSPALEYGLALPSWKKNSKFDLWADYIPFLEPDFPADDIWPSKPPREFLYCEAANSSHPMAAPATARTWKGSPPLWIACGQECLSDSAAVVAQTACRDGVPIVWLQYEAMPHCWMLWMGKFPHAGHLFKRWGKACSDLVKAEISSCQGSWIDVETLQDRVIDPSKLLDLGPNEARMLIKMGARGQPVFCGKRPGARL